MAGSEDRRTLEQFSTADPEPTAGGLHIELSTSEVSATALSQSFIYPHVMLYLNFKHILYVAQ